jgi:hypothetical protein
MKCASGSYMTYSLELEEVLNLTGVPSLIFGPKQPSHDMYCVLSILSEIARFAAKNPFNRFKRPYTNRCSTESFISITPTRNSLDLNILRSKNSK